MDDPNEAVSKSGPITSGDSRPRPIRLRRILAITTVCIVAIIIVTASAIVLINNDRDHLGIIPFSKVSAIAGQRFTVFYHNNSSDIIPYYSTPVKINIAFFNASDHNGSVIIASLEFSNRTLAIEFVNSNYAEWHLSTTMLNVNVTIAKGSYDGFNFSAVEGGYNLLGVVGYSGPFAFMIVASQINFSNVTALIHDEIQAMT